MLKKSAESGVSDGAFAVGLSDQINIAAGAFVADPAAVSKAFKDLSAAIAKKHPDMAKSQFNGLAIGDLKFQGVVIPVKDEKAQKILGENLDIGVGTGSAKNVYLVVGPKGPDLLKAALAAKSSSDSGKRPSVFQMHWC